MRTKVKDLPVILRTLIYDNVLKSIIEEEDLALQYLEKINWQSVTDAERLAYCEVRYPKGTKIRSAFSGEEDIVKLVHVSEENKGDIDAICEKESGRIIYDSGANKFAEIVSTPEETHEYKEPIKWNFDSELKEASPEPQFKAGDVVEVEGLEYMPEFVHSFDNVAWVKTSGQNFGQLVPLNKLRHPKDKIREKAEEFGDSLLAENYRGTTDNGGVHAMTKDWLIDKFELAIKWGQENK